MNPDVLKAYFGMARFHHLLPRFLRTPRLQQSPKPMLIQRVPYNIYYHYGIRSQKTIPIMVFGT